MSQPKSQDQPSLSFRGKKVVYRWPDSPIWELSVGQVAVVGEYTTADGPVLDDYFLIFITKTGARYVASFYADGRDSLLSQLGQTLDSELQCGLCNSTDLKSRVMWPAVIRDKPLFDFVPVEATSMEAHIKEWIVPTCELRLAGAVQEFLEK